MAEQNEDRSKPYNHLVGDPKSSREEREKAQRLEAERVFGKETSDYMHGLGQQITTAALVRMNQIKAEGGNADSIQSLFRDFSNPLYASVTSANIKPERFEEALKSVVSLLTPGVSEK